MFSNIRTENHVNGGPLESLVGGIRDTVLHWGGHRVLLAAASGGILIVSCLKGSGGSSRTPSEGALSNI